MRIAVCEDETLFRAQIVKEIECYYHSLDVVVDSFSSGEELIEKYEQGKQVGQLPHYDILFLDIEMKRLNGFETAKRLRAYGGMEVLIFLTSHTEMAMQGYEVNAFRFLGKPVNKEKLAEALGELEKRFLQEQTILLHTSEQDVKIPISSILYLESMKNDVYYYVLEHRKTDCVKTYKVRETITEAEELLKGNGFFRCHRSYLVQLMYVKSYTSKEMVLQNGMMLPISRGKAGSFKKALVETINKMTLPSEQIPF